MTAGETSDDWIEFNVDSKVYRFVVHLTAKRLTLTEAVKDRTRPSFLVGVMRDLTYNTATPEKYATWRGPWATSQAEPGSYVRASPAVEARIAECAQRAAQHTAEESVLHDRDRRRRRTRDTGIGPSEMTRSRH